MREDCIGWFGVGLFVGIAIAVSLVSMAPREVYYTTGPDGSLAMHYKCDRLR